MKCEFCGMELQPLTVHLMGKPVTVAHRECGCDASRIAQEAAQGKERERLALMAQYDITRAVRASGIPERYAKAKLPAEREGLYNLATHGGLYLFGSPGVGKTHIAAAIGINAIEDGMTVRFIKAHRVSDMMTLGNMNDAMELFVRPRLLILDDIGADNVGDWANTRLRSVIDERYDSLKPTMFTSNYAHGELMQRLKGDKTAQAIMSRIGEMGTPYKLEGKDWRKR